MDADLRDEAFTYLISFLLDDVVYPDIHLLDVFLGPAANPTHEPAFVEEALTIVDQSLARLNTEWALQGSRRSEAILLAYNGAVEDAVLQILEIEDFPEVAYSLVRIAHPNILGDRPSDMAAVAEAGREASNRVPLLEASTGPYEGLFYQHEAVLNLALTFARAGRESEAIALLERIVETDASRYQLSRAFDALTLISDDLVELEHYADSLSNDADRAEFLATISLELSRRDDLQGARTLAEIAIEIVERSAASGEVLPANVYIQLLSALFEAEAIESTSHVLDLAMSVGALDHPWDLHGLGVSAADAGQADLAHAVLSNTTDWFVEDGHDVGGNFAAFVSFADLVDEMAAAVEGDDGDLLCIILMMAELAIDQSTNPFAEGVLALRLAEIQARMGNWEQSRDWATLSVRFAVRVPVPLDRLQLLTLLTAFFQTDLPSYQAELGYSRLDRVETEACAG
jgi:tetratricopeptide (TPR) repeat protein